MPNHACTCLWSPCRCEWIDGLTPAERIREQDFLVDRFWQRRPGRQLARREAERQQVLAAKPTDSTGIDGLTADDRDRYRTLSAIPPSEHQNPLIRKSHEARRQPCAYCGVNDGKTERLEGTVLHPEFCLSAWRKDRRAYRLKATNLATAVNSDWKGIR